ncbi:hypothetical protein B0H14DRAFT_2608979 [Mycena olivaceomarginata]|nr:hypothetical protein B0H14DRAFT_2608979 [Mycena olivaceomarginata]
MHAKEHTSQNQFYHQGHGRAGKVNEKQLTAQDGSGAIASSCPGLGVHGLRAEIQEQVVFKVEVGIMSSATHRSGCRRIVGTEGTTVPQESRVTLCKAATPRAGAGGAARGLFPVLKLACVTLCKAATGSSQAMTRIGGLPGLRIIQC